MPWYSVRHVGQTIAVDVAMARPPPPPPRTIAGRARGRGDDGGDAAIGARCGCSGELCGGAFARRRSRITIATSPTITSASRPTTTTRSDCDEIGAATVVDGVNPDIDEPCLRKLATTLRSVNAEIGVHRRAW